MDIRTSQVLTAIDPLAVDLLLNLLPNPVSEMELIEATEGATQPTGHRKLRRLADAGIVFQPEGAKGRGRPWAISAPLETAALLEALFSLADTLESSDRGRRDTAREKLRSTRRGHLRSA